MSRNNEYTYQAFLSYSSNDSDTVEEIAKEMKRADVEIFLDEWNIDFGDHIFLEIESALEESKHFVLFISQSSLNSEWVDIERATALFRDPSNKNRRFIPVLLDDCSLPDIIKGFKYIDYNDDPNEALSNLIRICKTDQSPSAAGKDDSSLNQYCRRHIQRYDTLLEGRERIDIQAVDQTGTQCSADEALLSWINESSQNRLILLGDPGSGKTFLLRRVCSKLCENTNFTPVFIEGSSFISLPPTSHNDLLQSSDPSFDDESLLTNEKAIVIVDGLDELIGPTLDDLDTFERTLDNIDQFLGQTTKLITSCRTNIFEETSGLFEEHLGTSTTYKNPVDRTETAISDVLDLAEKEIDTITLQDVSEEQYMHYIESTIGSSYADTEAARYVRNNLPNVPVILRFLELALPEVDASIGDIDLDVLYSKALRVWIKRDSVFDKYEVSDLMKEMRDIYKNYPTSSSEIQSLGFVDDLEYSGLVEKGPRNSYRWFHKSIMEYLLSRSLFEEISKYDARSLARLNCSVESADGSRITSL